MFILEHIGNVIHWPKLTAFTSALFILPTPLVTYSWVETLCKLISMSIRLIPVLVGSGCYKNVYSCQAFLLFLLSP
jgi:hypothetical protein